MKKETKLGLFLLIAIIVFAFSILAIKDIRLEGGYKIHVYFNDVGGLLEKAWVRVNGVKVGKVEDIALEGRKAKVTVWIKSKVKLHRDTQATIASSGLLGVKYLELSLGGEGEPLLKDGDTVAGIDPISLDKMLSNTVDGINGFSNAIKGLLGDKGLIKNLDELLANLNELSGKLNRQLTEKRTEDFVKDVTSAAKDLKKITSDISEITGSEKENIKVAIENIKSITERLDKIVKDVETGEGSVGKLLSDKEMGENLKKTVESIKGTSDEAKKALGRLTLFRTYWEYELRHSGKYDEYKSDVGLKIRPRTGKYYYLGVSNAATANTKTNESKNTFNLNIGQSFNIDSVQFGTVYAGMIRSAGGAGIKVKPLWKWNPGTNWR